MSNEKSDSPIMLPHGAWFDEKSFLLGISLDRVTVTFTPDEFSKFVDQIEDIANFMAQMTTLDVSECPTCGTQMESMTVEPLKDEEYN